LYYLPNIGTTKSTSSLAFLNPGGGNVDKKVGFESGKSYMSPSSYTRLKASFGEIILRWAYSPSAPAIELPVEIVDEKDWEPIIRASLRIAEATPVTLVANDYTVNGIVRFCRADKNSYLITVATQDGSDERPATAYFRDPGSLVLDDFLTEEEEAKILESLESSARPLADEPWLFTLFRSLHSLLLQSMAAANRLFCFPVPA